MEDLIAGRDAMQDVPFGDVVESATGRRVLSVDPTAHAVILARLATAFDETLRSLNNPHHPIHESGRINEASRPIEEALRKRLDAVPGWQCSIPLTAEGREQRTGYPDLRIETDTGIVVYLDPKLFAASSRDSSLRTFYYEPKTLSGKITEDALHLLVGIAHESSGNSLVLTGWELVDLSRLHVKLKMEFQASNRDIYTPENLVLESGDPE